MHVPFLNLRNAEGGKKEIYNSMKYKDIFLKFFPPNGRLIPLGQLSASICHISLQPGQPCCPAVLQCGVTVVKMPDGSQANMRRSGAEAKPLCCRYFVTSRRDTAIP